MNLEMVDKTLGWLANQSVETICLCPGGRNAPFVVQLEKSKGFETLSFYDERSAGFFALGRSRRDSKPVAVITTSGTAVTEMLSALVEATYSQVPLIVITADRPKRLRGTGAPQTINQENIFGDYVEACLDIDGADEINYEWRKEKPLHINLCFDEPLFDPEQLSEKVYTQNEVEFKDFADFKPKVFDKALLVLGAMTQQESESVEKCLMEWSGPIYAESLSGLKNSKILSEKLLKSSENIISKVIKSGVVESVVRVGDIPVGRFWRDLDTSDIPITSISSKKYKGMERGELIHTSLENLKSGDLICEAFDWEEVKGVDAEQSKSLKRILKDFPRCEPTCYETLCSFAESADMVFLGNSLPVRMWDLIGAHSPRCWASRGVNGIDGQVSTALGLVEPMSKNWIFLGDLTTLYDFSGFWMTDYIKKIGAQVNFVVINNKGGQIFSRIFESPLFLNSHNISFEHFAKTWGWNYINEIHLENLNLDQGLNFIEINPDPEQTQIFWERYDQLWKN